jgi:DNA-binding ferritin-like protein (Dps family)
MLMNERLVELYRASKPKEALVSQDEYKTANVLLGSDVEKFAELIIKECVRYFNEDYQRDFSELWREDLSKGMKEHFGVK